MTSISIKEKEEKVNIIKQNLIIFKNAYRSMRIKSDEALERVEIGLTQEYYYRENVSKQIDIYKIAKNNADDSIGSDDYDVKKNLANDEKEKLSKIFDIYNKIRDEDSLEIADNAILDEANAHAFLLNCMSDLIGALMDLAGDQGESLINEINSILKN